MSGQRSAEITRLMVLILEADVEHKDIAAADTNLIWFKVNGEDLLKVLGGQWWLCGFMWLTTPGMFDYFRYHLTQVFWM